MTTTASNRTTSRWLAGPLRDLMLGGGLVYLIPFVALAVDGDGVRAALPMSVMPFLLLLTSVPHYGATLLRVYEHRADRRRYALFAVFATLALVFAFVVGLYDNVVGSWLLTIYLTWSPWHYSGQNYGIAMMFLRRRGIDVPPLARRLLHASFVLSFLLTALMLHAVDPAVSYAPGQYEGTEFRLVALGLPVALTAVLLPTLVGLYVGALGGAAFLLRRRGSWRDLTPAAALVASQALWFVLPALARRTGALQGIEPFGAEHATYCFLWIAITHALQDPWITHYYARGRGEVSLPWAAKAVAAGAAVWMLPVLLFAPGVLGRLPFDAGLGLLIATVVNIHHFVLDGAIWKLRDGPIARILLRGEAECLLDAPARVRWLRPLLFGGGALSIGLWCLAAYEQAWGIEDGFARGDLERVENASERLAAIGQGSAKVQLTLAGRFQQRGEPDRAEACVRGALSLYAGPDSLFEMSTFHHAARRGDQAIDAVERALLLRPDSRLYRHRLAWLLVANRAGDAAAVARALELLAAVVDETAGQNATYLHTLALAQAASGDRVLALSTAQRGLLVAEAQGDAGLIQLLRRHIDLYGRR